MAESLRDFPDVKDMGASLDLDLDTVQVIGRKTQRVEAEVLRELTEADLALLDTERGIQPTQIQRLSDRHHALARCLAANFSIADACAITGYTASRVSILKGDPAFEELVAFYRGPNAELAQDYVTKATIARNLATEVLIERLDEKPDEIATEVVIDIATKFADRTGHGPQSRSQHLHVHMNLADRLKAARQREGAATTSASGPGRVIEGSLAPTISPGGNDAND